MIATREGLPRPEDYIHLLELAGQSEFVNPMFVPRALEGSLVCVLAEDEGEIVGFGRIVGDGASCFWLHDVAVAPEYRRQGVGTRIMEHLLEFLRGSAPPQSFVGLLAPRGTGGFFERFGFQRRDVDEPGFFLLL